MEAEDRYPFMRSSKRTYTEMANSHRDPESSSPIFVARPHDDHYNNEHAARRPRLALPSMRDTPPFRFAGDGLDFRRPVLSAATSAAAAPVIDLTEDNEELDADEAQGGGLEVEAAPAVGGSSRASRLPRFGGSRSIIDLAGDANDAEVERADREGGHATGWSGLFTSRRDYTSGPPRPQFSQLRRPRRFGLPSGEAGVDGELEIVSERTLSRQPSPAAVQAPRSYTPFAGGADRAPLVDLTQDDEVLFVNERRREGRDGSGVNAAAPGTAGLGTRADDGPAYGTLGRIAGMLPQGGRLIQRIGDHIGIGRFDRDFGPDAARAARAYVDAEEDFEIMDALSDNEAWGLPRHRYAPRPSRRRAGVPAAPPPPPRTAVGVGLNLPFGMDYMEPAFDMQLPGGNRPASPKYEPPSPASDGFTRSPGEDEVVVCPNCGDELAVSEDEVKQQVWVIKACGHAYCGECATHRTRGARTKKGGPKSKGKEKAVEGLPPPFSRCVVEGCGRKTLGTTGMIHVYLGS